MIVQLMIYYYINMYNDNLLLDKFILNGFLVLNIMYYCWNVLYCIKCIYYNLFFLLMIFEFV